jgi:hypothetical protein
VKEWTPGAARRFLRGIETALAGDLPLFAAGAVRPPSGEYRLQRVGGATLGFLERLVRTAASRRGIEPAEGRRRRDLCSLALPGGPALLAVREGRDRWLALLALDGPIAEEVAPSRAA